MTTPADRPETMSMHEAIEVLRPLGPTTINALAAAVTPYIRNMRWFDTNGKVDHATLSDCHVIPGIVIAALDAAGYDIVPKAERPSVCPTCGSGNRETVEDDCDMPGRPPLDPWHGGAE